MMSQSSWIEEDLESLSCSSVCSEGIATIKVNRSYSEPSSRLEKICAGYIGSAQKCSLHRVKSMPHLLSIRSKSCSPESLTGSAFFSPKPKSTCKNYRHASPEHGHPVSRPHLPQMKISPETFPKRLDCFGVDAHFMNDSPEEYMTGGCGSRGFIQTDVFPEGQGGDGDEVEENRKACDVGEEEQHGDSSNLNVESSSLSGNSSLSDVCAERNNVLSDDMSLQNGVWKYNDSLFGSSISSVVSHSMESASPGAARAFDFGADADNRNIDISSTEHKCIDDCNYHTDINTDINTDIHTDIHADENVNDRVNDHVDNRADGCGNDYVDGNYDVKHDGDIGHNLGFPLGFPLSSDASPTAASDPRDIQHQDQHQHNHDHIHPTMQGSYDMGAIAETTEEIFVNAGCIVAREEAYVFQSEAGFNQWAAENGEQLRWRENADSVGSVIIAENSFQNFDDSNDTPGFDACTEESDFNGISI